MADWERLFVMGQLCTYIEQVCTGAKLACQFGCHASHMGWIEETVAKEGCRIWVDRERSGDRFAVWVFKHEYVGSVIAELSARSTTPPTVLEVWCAGKLFGLFKSRDRRVFETPRSS